MDRRQRRRAPGARDRVRVRPAHLDAPEPGQSPAPDITVQVDDEELVVITAWPDHDTFDAWINTPDRGRLTASAVHAAVDFRPITRLDVIGGYPDNTSPRTNPTGDTR